MAETKPKMKKEAFEKGYREFLGERVKKTPARPMQKVGMLLRKKLAQCSTVMATITSGFAAASCWPSWR